MLSFGPQHLSLYSLTREEGTLYDRMILGKKLKEMPAAEQDRLWLRGARLLRERGFVHYEISNFAPAGLGCPHNERYWRLDPYLGIGPAAVSTLPGGSTGVVRLSEPRSIHAWLEGCEPAVEEVPPRDFLFENLMMGLRLAQGVPVSRIRGRFGEEALQWLLDEWERAGGQPRDPAPRREPPVDAAGLAPAEPPPRAAAGGHRGADCRSALWPDERSRGLRARPRPDLDSI